MSAKTVLIVEDSPALAMTYQQFLAEEGYPSIIAGEAGAAGKLLEQKPAAILLDLNLPGQNGIEFLSEIRKNGNRTPVIVATAESSVDNADAAIQAGAEDFISKPLTRERLALTLRNVIERQQLQSIVEGYKTVQSGKFCDFIGKSPAMQAVYRIIENAAASKAPVFITGESGTGKELAARALHQLSPRKNQPFESLNCAAIPANLIESEIFGHARGSFTGATAAYAGAAMRSHRGSLFLDEVTEMPLELQSKLLRFTQTGTFRAVGGDREQSVDVRFISATNRDPLQAVRDGKLREDLYYRLNVIPVHLPPLRERGQDVLLIAESLLKKISAEEKKKFQQLDEEVKKFFLSYAWPGNVRQLENTLRRIIVQNTGETLTMAMLPPMTDRPAESAAPPAAAEPEILPLYDVERRAIEQAIGLCNGNISEAARCLKINPSTIHRKLGRWRD